MTDYLYNDSESERIRAVISESPEGLEAAWVVCAFLMYFGHVKMGL